MLGKRLGLLMAGIVPALSLAAPVQFDFSGSFVGSNPSVLGLNLSGQSFSGTLLYNDDPALAVPYGPGVSVWNFHAPYSLTITAGSNVISSNGYRVIGNSSSSLQISAGADSTGSPPSTTLSINGVASSDPTAGLFFVFLSDASNPLDTLPVIPTKITGSAYGYIFDHRVGTAVNTLPFTVTSFSATTPAVPEPNTYVMTLLGLTFVSSVVRRSKTV